MHTAGLVGISAGSENGVAPDDSREVGVNSTDVAWSGVRLRGRT
jgi:hypothetical protein